MSDTRRSDLTRRGFLAKTGQGLAAAEVLGSLATRASPQQVPESPAA